jgi:hypothetical protein
MRSHLILLAVAVLLGCGDSKTQESKTPESKTNPHPKAQAKYQYHSPHGPHHGHVFTLIPEGFPHVPVEIVDDDDAKKVVAYLWDPRMEKEASSSAAEATIDITKKGETKTYRLKGEMKDGKASSYSSSDPELLDAIDAKGAKVVFHLELDGKRYYVNVEHVEH